jgi:hypothetical protein
MKGRRRPARRAGAVSTRAGSAWVFEQRPPRLGWRSLDSDRLSTWQTRPLVRRSAPAEIEVLRDSGMTSMHAFINSNLVPAGNHLP